MPFLELPANHANFEQNSLCLNLLANLVELRRRDLFGTVCNIQKHALQLIQDTGKCGVAFLQSGLAVQAVFIEQIFGTALLSGDVHVLLRGIARRGIRKLDEHHL